MRGEGAGHPWGELGRGSGCRLELTSVSLNIVINDLGMGVSRALIKGLDTESGGVPADGLAPS